MAVRLPVNIALIFLLCQRRFVDPATLLTVFLIAIFGALLGIGSALIPGMHINTFSLLLLSLYPELSLLLSSFSLASVTYLDPPMMFAILLVSAATGSSFTDFLPSTFLGLPESDTSMSMLPAHRLLLQGKGMDAVRFSATGSLLGALLAVLATYPLQLLMRPPFLLGDALSLCLPYLLLVIVAMLILSEHGPRRTIAFLDLRSGHAKRAEEVNIRLPIPIDGEEGVLTGRAIRRGFCRSKILTPHGVFFVRHRTPLPKGQLHLRGIWCVKESRGVGRLRAFLLIMLSGLLGFCVMEAHPPWGDVFPGMGQSLLFPLLSGLFAFPALISSFSSGPVPPQDAAQEASISILPALRGSLAGFLSGWLPGITSTIGATIGTLLSPPSRDQEQASKDYLLMLAAVGTSAAVFSILALCIEGEARTGAMLVLEKALGKERTSELSHFPAPEFSMLILAVLVSAIIGYLLSLKAGALLSQRVAGRDLRKLNQGVLILLLLMILAFCGLGGIVVLMASIPLGLLPAHLGVKRVHLTGCLLLPLLFLRFGLEDEVIALLWNAP
ncbi:MAG: tripartite tricarboxylate transporter permease [Methanomassiliicoccales archaeon]